MPKVGEKVLLADYPAGKSAFDGKMLTSAKAQVTSAYDETGKLTYNIDTFTGNSGVPVWHEISENQKKSAISPAS